MERERLGSRLGFILLSAGCAIGCGNVWKFPWMTSAYGGGSFVLVYLLCLILLGLPCMTMEFALGRASQQSPVRMYRPLEKKGQKWHIHGYFALLGNFCLMAFYSVVAGWFLYYLVKFVSGDFATLSFSAVTADWRVCLGFMLITVVVGFAVLIAGIQKVLEKVTKPMMIALFVLLLGLVVYALTLPGSGDGLRYYLIPDFTKIKGPVVVAAMNQAFFTLSIGIGSMAIFGSYIGKERSLMGESVRVIALDTLVAIMAGLIIFPACFSTGKDASWFATSGNVAGPGLLFTAMIEVFNKMGSVGRWIGTLFFLFMVFAAFSTVFAVFENILACVRELLFDIRKSKMEKKGLSTENLELMPRWMGCIISGIVVAVLATTTALGWNVWSTIKPFGEGTNFMDLWDFAVNTVLLPIGAVIITLFCCTKLGWGWDNFVEEANSGSGMKVKKWMKPIFKYFIPIVVTFLFVYGILSYFHII